MPDHLAADLLHARDHALLLPPPSSHGEFSLERGYAIQRLLDQRLRARGWQAVGRKIGFTNPATWQEFGLRTPIWAHIYDRTVHPASETPALALEAMAAPRIEPEVVLKLASPPSSASAEALVACVEWVAIGFELVDCHYPEWRFTAADAVADFGVHAALVVGVPWRPGDPAELAEGLRRLTVSLQRNGEEVATGRGVNALGSPLLALDHLAGVLAEQPWAAPLAAGEVVTTGTLTPLPAVAPGERWRVEVAGLPLAALELALD